MSCDLQVAFSEQFASTLQPFPQINFCIPKKYNLAVFLIWRVSANFSNPSFQICRRSNNLSSSRNAWTQCLGESSNWRGSEVWSGECREAHLGYWFFFALVSALSSVRLCVSSLSLILFTLPSPLYLLFGRTHASAFSIRLLHFVQSASNPYQWVTFQVPDSSNRPSNSFSQSNTPDSVGSLIVCP